MDRRILYAFYTFVGIFSVVTVGFLGVNVARYVLDHQERIDREEKHCRDAGWIWFRLTHGKAVDQFICIPPTPRGDL